MKKILHLQLLPLLAGVQNFSLHLLEGLPGDEFEIHVACKPGGPFVDAVKERGYHFHPLPWLRRPISWLDLVSLIHLILLLKRGGYDIVHTHTSKLGFLGRLAARICGVPLILHTAHGSAFQQGQPLWVSRFYMLLERFGNNLSHKTVFVNNTDRERFINLGLIPGRKAETIYNAIPVRQSAALAQLARERKPDKGIDDCVIGSTLRFSYQKNVIALVSAACKACKFELNLRFILLGEGGDLALCKQIVHSHGLNGRILFPGWDSSIEPWLRMMDAFVLYSRWEAQPFSVIEAMHSGLPVIGSAIPSIMELVDESCGWLIPVEDQSSLADAFLTVASDRATAYQKGLAASRRIQTLCDYGCMLDRYLELYRSVG